MRHPTIYVGNLKYSNNVCIILYHMDYILLEYADGQNWRHLAINIENLYYFSRVSCMYYALLEYGLYYGKLKKF